MYCRSSVVGAGAVGSHIVHPWNLGAKLFARLENLGVAVGWPSGVGLTISGKLALPEKSGTMSGHIFGQNLLFSHSNIGYS